VANSSREPAGRRRAPSGDRDRLRTDRLKR
jgi:hypothetical protein